MSRTVKILNIDNKEDTMLFLNPCSMCADARWTDLKTVMAILVQQHSDDEIRLAMEEVHRRGYELHDWDDPNTTVRMECKFTIPDVEKDGVKDEDGENNQ